MNKSTALRPAQLLEQMGPAARARFSTDAEWARAAGVPKETLSRLKNQPTCELRTLGALAESAGCKLVAVPAVGEGENRGPERFDRDYEDKLLDLAASGQLDPEVWRA